MAEITTIELKKTTHQKLKLIGNMTESFDDVVNRLIKDNEHINHLINYIDKKFEYEFASREVGGDGYTSSCVTERKAMESAKNRIYGEVNK